MVELELLEGREGTIAHLRELELALLQLAGAVEPVVRRRRVTEIGQRYGDDAADRKQRSEHKGETHGSAGTPAAAYRVASRRCSRASGQSAIRDPSRKTNPASQIRFTSGFTKTRK